VSDASLLVFARCAGFVFRAPGFSHPAVPPPLRAGFAYALALTLAPAASVDARLAHGAAFAFALAAEVALGAALGTAASLLYDGAYAGGRLVDDYIGIRANASSPNLAATAGFGRLWSLAYTAGFFTLGGDRIVLETFAAAFATLPPGVLAGSAQLATFAIALPATLIRAALLVGGPAFVCAFAGQIALAVLARVVPRLSPFTLSFGVACALALFATLLSLPVLVPAAARPWLVPLGPR
jgi:type III secretory pathway component EscT